MTPSIDRTLHQFLTITDLDLITEFDFLLNCARFPYNICNGCGMPTEDAYSSGHLVLSHLGFANILLVRPLKLNHTLHQFVTHFPDLTFYRLWHYYRIQVSKGHLQRVWHVDRGRLLLWTPGPVPLWDLHVFLCRDQSLLNLSCLRTFEFRTPLGTSLLLWGFPNINCVWSREIAAAWDSSLIFFVQFRQGRM